MAKQNKSSFIREFIEDKEKMDALIESSARRFAEEVLGEAVTDELNRILSESPDDEYEEQDVQDEVDAPVDEKTPDQSDEDPAGEEGLPDEDLPAGDGGEETPVEPEENPEPEPGSEEDPSAAGDGEEETDPLEEPEVPGDEGGEDDWSEFDAYKGDDDTYDVRDADDETALKIYKLMSDDDVAIFDTDDSGIARLKDEKTGDEYIVVDPNANLGGEEVPGEEAVESCGKGESCGMSEGEVNLGYTDNYQDKNPMTTPSNAEPADKSATRSIDAGVPTGTTKPWAGKGDMKPFNESEDTCPDCGEKKENCKCDDKQVEEATNVGGFVQQNSTSKSHVPNSDGRDARNASVAGVKTKGTEQPRYTNEAIDDMKRRANAIWAENQALKNAIRETNESLKKAMVINHNLAQITKLFVESTTTKDEKLSIIRRFDREAKTLDESKKLYAVIKEELNEPERMRITNIDRQLSESRKDGNGKLSETKIYESEGISEALSLMQRMSML